MTKVELPRWLADSEHLPMFLEGQIDHETEKAVFFTGQAVIQESKQCRRCRRRLTHPASQAVGYGPECCERLGIERPALHDAELLAEQLRQVSKVSRWLPKSRVKISGYIPPTRRVDRPQISVVKNVLRVKCDFTIRHLAKAVPTYMWNKKMKTWDYPCSRRIAEQLIEKFRDEDLQVSLEVQALVGAPRIQVEGDILFDYQKVGVQFLVDVQRVLLADEMGLGKTIQAIASCRARGAKKVLTICPNTLKWTWQKEIKKWYPEASVQVITGDQDTRLSQIAGDAMFKIVNYEVLTFEKHSSHLPDKDRSWSRDVKELEKVRWDTVILDEVHRVKNRKAQVTRAVKRITKDVPHVYQLSGTPILNYGGELWSLLNILYPTQFRSYWRFVERYCFVTYNGYGNVVGPLRPEMAGELRNLLKTISIRRLKKDVLKDLPGKLPIKRIWVKLVGEQRRVYEEMANEMYTKLSSGETVSAAVVIAQITRLKQIAIDEQLMTPDLKPLRGAKIDALFEFLDSCGKDKVVVFSQFARAIDRLELVCQTRGISHAKLTGDVVGEDREKAIEEFQTDPDCQLFLCSTRAGGVGITLTAAHTAVFLDKFWSPTSNWQAQERLDRIGQAEKVTIVEFLAADTIEEGIEGMLTQKTNQFAALFDIADPGTEELGPVDQAALLDLLKFGLP